MPLRAGPIGVGLQVTEHLQPRTQRGLHPLMLRNHRCNSFPFKVLRVLSTRCTPRCHETTSATGPVTACSGAGQSEGRVEGGWVKNNAASDTSIIEAGTPASPRPDRAGRRQPGYLCPRTQGRSRVETLV